MPLPKYADPPTESLKLAEGVVDAAPIRPPNMELPDVDVAMKRSAANAFVPVAMRMEPFHVSATLLTRPVVSSPTVPDVVIVPPVRPLLVAIDVTDPVPKHVPDTATHPLELNRFIPP